VPQRADLVKTRGFDLVANKYGGAQGSLANTFHMASDDKVGTKEGRRLRMSTCRLTGEPLAAPMMGDMLGNLYNKEDVISFLLSKKMPIPFSHIQKLRDLKDVRVVNSTSAGAGADADARNEPVREGAVDQNRGDSKMFLCPLSGKDLDDGTTRGVLLWGCGCIFSKAAFEPFRLRDGESCPSCGEQIGEVILLAPDAEEAKVMFEKLPQKVKDKVAAIRKREKEKLSAIAPGRGAFVDKDKSGGSGAAGATSSSRGGGHSSNNKRAAGDPADAKHQSNKRRKEDVGRSSSSVFNQIFRPSAELNTMTKRDGFGTGGAAR